MAQPTVAPNQTKNPTSTAAMDSPTAAHAAAARARRPRSPPMCMTAGSSGGSGGGGSAVNRNGYRPIASSFRTPSQPTHTPAAKQAAAHPYRTSISTCCSPVSGRKPGELNPL